MAGWKSRRAATVGIGSFALAALSWAVSVQAQPPRDLPPVEALPLPRETAEPPIARPAGADRLPPLVVDDPSVEPVQFTRPGGPLPAAKPSPVPSRPVADPPPPVVRIQVRVAADSPPGDDIRYQIIVTNSSQADAHSVTVRNPIPEGVAGIVKSDPPPDEKLSTPQQIVWQFGTLKPGQVKTIDLILKPKPEAKEVKNLAYVRFEHGEQVVTRINKPSLKVTKSAPKQAVRDEPFVVRVLVENPGKVPAENIRIIENIDPSAEFEAITAGAKRTKPDANQWQWEFAKLMPGERKVFEYRVIPKQATDAVTVTHAEAKNVLEKAEARTQVLVPGLSTKLIGPTGVVAPGEAAKYEITVRNTGTMPSTNVRVSGTIPADCKPTMKTEGGQVYRDQILWTIPRLEPGEGMTFRYGLRAGTTGRRVVVASASDARKVRSSDEATTLFQGTAALVWETIPEPAAIAVGRRGTFTVRVKNNGGESARNVRVEVELPDAVGLVQATPSVVPAGRTIAFPAETIEPYSERVYTVTFEARQSAQAWFKVKMTGEPLGDRPMTTEKAIEITGGN